MQKTNKLFIITFIMILFFSLINMNSVYACVGTSPETKGVQTRCGGATIEEVQPHNSGENYVGSDIEVKEGEAGITSIQEPGNPQILIDKENTSEEGELENTSVDAPFVKPNKAFSPSVEYSQNSNEESNINILWIISIVASSVISIVATYFYMKNNKKD